MSGHIGIKRVRCWRKGFLFLAIGLDRVFQADIIIDGLVIVFGSGD
jgi:hypothetical protein